MNEEKKIYSGEVCWFNSKKGYGFISYEINGVKQTDIFVHYSDLCIEGYKALYKEQKVNFTIGINKRGQPKAVDVVIISK